jgi:hypothetical protein
MTYPFLPVSLFFALCLSVVAVVPLAEAGHGFVWVAAVAFAAALGALAWLILRADNALDPRLAMERSIERFEQRWPKFERDFWAHVAENELAVKPRE